MESRGLSPVPDDMTWTTKPLIGSSGLSLCNLSDLRNITKRIETTPMVLIFYETWELENSLRDRLSPSFSLHRDINCNLEGEVMAQAGDEYKVQSQGVEGFRFHLCHS